MKKIELHCHLDGSLNIEYANKLIGFDVKDKLVSTKDKNLTEYLKRFDLPIDLLQTKDNIEEFSYLLSKDLEKDEVIYAEVRFCPLLHTKKGLSIDEVINSVIDGFYRNFSVKVNLILCMMRNLTFDENKTIIDYAIKYKDDGVVGIDLAGDEIKYKTKDFEKLFDIAKENNIPFTIHAGEADGHESIDAAIKFGAKRIGHGIKAIENKNTIKKILQNDILLEICPSSNDDTGIYSITKNPFKELYDMGAKICINTDNRTVSNTNLKEEYEQISEIFGFTNQELINFNLNAIDKAFCSDFEKYKLRKEILNEK